MDDANGMRSRVPLTRSRSLDENVGRIKKIPSSKFAKTTVDLRQPERSKMLRRHASLAIIEGTEMGTTSWEALSPMRDESAEPIAPPPPPRSRAAVATLLLLVLTNVTCGLATQAVLEVMYSHDRNCGTMVSLVEAVAGALASSSALFGERRLPLSAHLQLFVTAVGFSLLSNAGLASGLPMSLALVLKNGHVLANMAVGALSGKRYSRRQLLAVLVITVGLLLATAAQSGGGGGSGGAGGSGGGGGAPEGERPWFGVLCMVGALLMRAAGGIVQERTFSAHGIHTVEMIFGRAALAIPIFASRVETLRSTLSLWSRVAPMTVLGLSLPTMWLLLGAEVATDHGTKLATTRLIGETSALTVTLLFTLQRFLSLAVSAAVFSPAGASPMLWAGIVLVGAGSVGYAL